MNLFIFLLTMASSVTAFACRPNLDQSYLGNDLEDQPAPFALKHRLEVIMLEERRVFPFRIDKVGFEEEEVNRVEIERKELMAALDQSGIAKESSVKITNYFLKSRENPGFESNNEFENKIPIEFKLYRDGVHEMMTSQGSVAEAVKSWNTLLGLPASQRQKRTTWTLFMLGVIQIEPSETAQYFRKLRVAIREGYSDPLNLGLGSYRVQSQRAGSPAQELIGQLGLALAGVPLDEYVLNRIRMLTWKILENIEEASESDLSDLLDPTNLRLINNVLLDEFGRKNEVRIRAIEYFFDLLGSQPSAKIVGLDELAWGAYTNGYYGLAKKWIKKADEISVLTWMLRSRLAHREGQFASGFALADKAMNLYQEQTQYSPLIKQQGEGTFLFTAPELILYFSGQTAWTAFSLGQYRKAFHYFLFGRHWVDLAFIAERFLSMEELKNELSEINGVGAADFEKKQWLSNLVGSRLMREGEVESALPYFDDKVRAIAEKYLTLLRKVNSESDNRRLAEFKFQIAELLRYNGMELFGLETDPDWRIWRGNYVGPKLSSLLKAAQPKKFDHCEDRFHYRFRAADIAVDAALQAKDPVFKCHALGTAGRWIHLQRPDLGRQIKMRAKAFCSKNQKAYEVFVSAWSMVSAGEIEAK